MKLKHIKDDLYRILDHKTIEQAASMFCDPNHPLMKDFWDVNCPRRGFLISLYNNPFYKEIDSKADLELNKLAQKARVKYSSISKNPFDSPDMEIWKECVDTVFEKDKWDLFFRYYSEFGREVLAEIAYLREEENHSAILYDYHAKDSVFKLLYEGFVQTCEFYIEQAEEDLETARERIIERLYPDMNSYVLHEIEFTIKKCTTPEDKINYISQLLEEKDAISYKDCENEKLIDSYLEKRKPRN